MKKNQKDSNIKTNQNQETFLIKFWILFKKFWNYTWHDDSFGSYISALLVSIVLIKFIIFPTLGLVFNTDYPIVAIVSGSMEHKVTNGFICSNRIEGVNNQKLNLKDYWNYCGDYYENNFNLNYYDFEEFKYKNGLNIGDVMVLFGKNTQNIQIGEVLVFIPQDERFYQTKGPVIHRIVNIYEENGKRYFQTKGDHNGQSFVNFENKISEDKVIGVAVFRIPYLGYPKLWLSNILSRI